MYTRDPLTLKDNNDSPCEFMYKEIHIYMHKEVHVIAQGTRCPNPHLQVLPNFYINTLSPQGKFEMRDSLFLTFLRHSIHVV